MAETCTIDCNRAKTDVNWIRDFRHIILSPTQMTYFTGKLLLEWKMHFSLDIEVPINTSRKAWHFYIIGSFLMSGTVTVVMTVKLVSQ